MTNEYRETKNAIREALATLPTQRLADIVCFTRDGKMDFYNPCCCFKGVSLARNLHITKHYECPEPVFHYSMLRFSDFWITAETAYKSLGRTQADRDRRFIPIVCAALKIRMRGARQPAALTEATCR